MNVKNEAKHCNHGGSGLESEVCKRKSLKILTSIIRVPTANIPAAGLPSFTYK